MKKFTYNLNQNDVEIIVKFFDKKLGYGVGSYILNYLYANCHYCKKFITDKTFLFSDYELSFNPFLSYTNQPYDKRICIYFPNFNIPDDDIYIYFENKNNICGSGAKPLTGIPITKNDLLEFLKNYNKKYILTCSQECYFLHHNIDILPYLINLYIISN